MVEYNRVKFDAGVSLQCIVDVPELPASFTVYQQDADFVIDHCHRKLPAVVVFASLTGQRIGRQGELVPPQLADGQWEVEFHLCSGGRDRLDHRLTLFRLQFDSDRLPFVAGGVQRRLQNGLIILKHRLGIVERSDCQILGTQP